VRNSFELWRPSLYMIFHTQHHAAVRRARNVATFGKNKDNISWKSLYDD